MRKRYSMVTTRLEYEYQKQDYLENISCKNDEMRAKRDRGHRINPVKSPVHRSHVYTDLSEKTGNQSFDSFAVAR